MTDHDRDRSIEMLLRSHRADDAAPLSQDCLDAEMLAAWMEGELPERARVSAERHAAGCSRCQALLAAMARTEPDVAARRWWSTLNAKWLVPIAAIATALFVWISVERTLPDSATSPAPPATVAVPSNMPPAEKDKAAQTAQQLAAALERRRTAETAAGGSADSRDAFEAKRVSPPPPAANVMGGTTTRKLDAVQPKERAIADTAAKSATAPSAAPPAPASPAPLAAPGSVSAVPPPQQMAAAAKPLAETVRVVGEPVAGALAAGAGGDRGVAVAVEIRSPEPRYRWRIVPPDGIQRTTDAGVTWTVVDAARTESQSSFTLVAGSSPARDVCWLVGRAGVVLLSTDGATWQRRSLPEAVDLTAVGATDAMNAIVTAADRRRFATVDGGLTWTPMK